MLITTRPSKNSQAPVLTDTTQLLLLALAADPSASISATILANPGYLAHMLALAAPLPEDKTPYSRNVLFSGDLGEAMVAHWPAGAECRPHDHGHSSGVVTVLRGDFYEQDYRLLNNGLEKAGAERHYVAGDTLPVSFGDIHSMRSPQGGVTLHLYVPSIHSMKVYDEHTIYTVAGNCGAWIPEDQSLILEREPFGTNPLHHALPRGRLPV